MRQRPALELALTHQLLDNFPSGIACGLQTCLSDLEEQHLPMTSPITRMLSRLLGDVLKWRAAYSENAHLNPMLFDCSH